jgi:tRNA U34 5-carboxymethylaminomethyl modifying GTPase MnmE/TrmE
MANSLIEEKVKQYRTQIESSVEALYNITELISHNELKATVSDIKDRIDDPYMFVIVGEVKAGKSSFINALLDADKEICKVAASPMTDTIQQIVYGEQEAIIDINQYLKRITQPIDILKDVAIVDTPGTNTIIDHHQEITEKFIPASDLIVFVFESKNPYRQSSWEFFDYINEEWRKKIIFILQQKDLMVPEDLVTNINGVKNQAIKKGIPSPNVFAVSAKQEINNQKDESGFIPVRKYIYDNITGGKAPYLKLINNADTTININEKIYKGVLLRKEQYESDYRFRQDIRESLDHQELKTKRQVNVLVENLLASYDRITNKKKSELNSGVGFVSMIKRSISSTFGGGQSAKDWLENITKDLENDLNKEFKDKLQDGVVDIADSIQDMGKLIDAKIKNSETILKQNHEIFADIAEKRANVLKDLQQAFAGFLKRSENFYDSNLLDSGNSVGSNLAAGGGIAAVGIILATLTNTMMFDITGGILTTIGFVFAGVSITLNKSKLIKQYEKEVAVGRDRIEREVTEKLNSYTHNIKEKIEDNFYKFDKLLSEEKGTIEHLENEYTVIESSLKSIKSELQTIVGAS